VHTPLDASFSVELPKAVQTAEQILTQRQPLHLLLMRTFPQLPQGGDPPDLGRYNLETEVLGSAFYDWREVRAAGQLGSGLAALSHQTVMCREVLNLDCPPPPPSKMSVICLTANACTGALCSEYEQDNFNATYKHDLQTWCPTP